MIRPTKRAYSRNMAVTAACSGVLGKADRYAPQLNSSVEASAAQ